MTWVRVLRVLLVVLGVGTLGGLLLPLLVAGETPVAPGAADSAPLALGAMTTPSTGPAENRAVQLLRRAASAGRSRAYSGTQYVSSWSRTGTSSVVVDLQHVPDQGMVVHIDGGPSAPPAVGQRHAPAVIDDPTPAGLDRRPFAALERHYVLRVAGTGHCAGRVADIVEARRVSGGQLTARFWVDRATGLLLRRELYDASGRTVRAAAFVDLRLSVGGVPRRALAQDRTGPSRGELGVRALRRLRHAGWTVPQTLPGGLELYDARMRRDSTGTGGRERVLHLSYSDGLFTVSVFAQRGRLDTARFSGWSTLDIGGTTVYTKPGLSEQAVWSGRNRVYTAVADAPDATVARTVETFPHEVASDHFFARVDRGFAKMAAWFN